MVKKLLAKAALFCLAFCLLFGATPKIFAAEGRVFDDADLLSVSEVEALESKIQALESKYKINIVIHTVEGTGGKSIRTYTCLLYTSALSPSSQRWGISTPS